MWPVGVVEPLLLLRPLRLVPMILEPDFYLWVSKRETLSWALLCLQDVRLKEVCDLVCLREILNGE